MSKVESTVATQVAVPGGGSLLAKGLNAGYGKIAVLHDISLQVAAGESVALLGANGAGKTTFLRTVSGLMRPTSGRIELGGEDVVRCSPTQILRRGMAHVPQGRQIFGGLSVRENLLLGCRLRTDKAAIKEELEYMLEVFPALAQKIRQPAGDLSGGQQQALAIARALMSNPSLLLLDEPSLGLAPRLVDDLCQMLSRIRDDRKMGMLVVEQDTLLALELTERAYVLQRGEIIMTGRSAELASDPAVVYAYLGGGPEG
ncbi:ABC transporter ATP-binding protein [Phytoactinopolyspora endophytica]|uniref:ABC transporter ATP-binding protein n=1 Tax=Phytoactinopolyspora endophytica TaxID=1642495 RepID=UPI00101BAC75|nr:ABC transporter ATP-binding protein [Phytoactinopolyspora endophytica]